MKKSEKTPQGLYNVGFIGIAARYSCHHAIAMFSRAKAFLTASES